MLTIQFLRFYDRKLQRKKNRIFEQERDICSFLHVVKHNRKVLLSPVQYILNKPHQLAVLKNNVEKATIKNKICCILSMKCTAGNLVINVLVICARA